MAIPDLQFVRSIGRGAYGEVWLARHKALGTWRAVKVIRRAEFDDDRPVRREFEGIRHYEPISRTHPNLVGVLHVGGDEAGFYYVMELADAVQTGTLVGQDPEPSPTALPRTVEPDDYVPRTLRADLKARGQFTAEETVGLGRALAGAWAYLHAHALVHRDVKPSNIIFVEGVLKLADIGLVTDISDSRSFVGTEGYMPPEGPGTTSADCHALGKVLYELSTGRDRRDFPEPPADLPTRPDREPLLELNAVLHRACAPDPRQRYPDARAMLADLEHLDAGESVRARQAVQRRWARVKRVAAPVAGILLVAGLAWAAFRSGRSTQQAQPPAAAVVSPHSKRVARARRAGVAKRLECVALERRFAWSAGHTAVGEKQPEFAAQAPPAASDAGQETLREQVPVVRPRPTSSTDRWRRRDGGACVVRRRTGATSRRSRPGARRR